MMCSVVLLALLIPYAAGAVVYVPCGAPDCNFQSLVDAARRVANGDTILLGRGTFLGPCRSKAATFNSSVHSVIIQGNDTTIDCLGNGGVFFRLPTTTIRGLSVQNTNATVVLGSTGPITIIDSIFTSCTGEFAGVVFTEGESVTVVNSTFIDCVTVANGTTGPEYVPVYDTSLRAGAVLIAGKDAPDATLTVADSFFTGCSCLGGGDETYGISYQYEHCAGAVLAWGDVTVTRSNFTWNQGGSSGAVLSGSTIFLHDSYFAYNTNSPLETVQQPFVAAAVASAQDGITATDCVFANNMNSSSVLAVWKIIFGAQSLTIDFTTRLYRCRFTNHNLLPYGTLMTENQPGVLLEDCIVDQNEVDAVTYGAGTFNVTGGLFLSNFALTCVLCGSGTVQGAIFTHNTAAGGCIGGTTMYVSDSQFLDTDGLGVTLSAGAVTNCTFVGNTVAGSTSQGAGVLVLSYTGGSADGEVDNYAYGTYASIANCSFIDNAVGGCGGAVFIGINPHSYTPTPPTVLVTGNRFVVNQAHGSGGAVAVAAAIVTLSDNYFESNHAANGGAVFMSSAADTLTLEAGNVFSNNHASGAGSVLSCEAGELFATTGAATVLGGQSAGADFSCGQCGCCEPPADSPVLTSTCLLMPGIPCDYACPTGSLSLSSNVTCTTTSSQGNELVPPFTDLCQVITCSHPAQDQLPPNSIIDGGSCSGVMNSTCCLSCAMGYQLQGGSASVCGVCTASGQFEGQSIACVPLPNVTSSSSSSTSAPVGPSTTGVAPSTKAPSQDLLVGLLSGGILLLLMIAGTVGMWRWWRRRGGSSNATPRELTDPAAAYSGVGGDSVEDGASRPLLSSTQSAGRRYDVTRDAEGTVVGTTAGTSGDAAPVRFAIDTGGINQVPWDDLTLIDELGHGGFGTVYHVRQKSTFTDMALKIINHVTSMEQVLAFLRETTVHAKLHHPHCLPFFGVVIRTSDVGILSQLMYSDLGRTARTLAPKARVKALLGASRGLAYLHSMGITHADLKPSNVLVDEHGHAVLADFGLSGVKAAHGYTERYAAPEVLGGGQPDTRADVYSLGCLIAEILSQVAPFEGVRDIHAAHKTHRGPYERLVLIGLPTDTPAVVELLGVVMRCLAERPEGRPVVTDVITGLQHVLEAA